MIGYNLQIFAKRGNGSNQTANGFINNSGASDKAVSLLRQARDSESQSVSINETRGYAALGLSGAKAPNPSNSSLERELENLARENGMSVRFITRKHTERGDVRTLRGRGTGRRDSTYIAQRIMILQK